MDPILARLISIARGGKTAMVVVYSGEGSQRRSITVHLQRGKDGSWRGHNPDKAAVARLDAVEAVERGAVEARELCEAVLANLESAVVLFPARKPDMNPGEYRKALRELKMRRKNAAANLAVAIPIARDAKEAADKVRATVSRMPKFVF